MAGLGGRRRRRRWQVFGALGALAIVVSAVYAIRQLMHGGLEPSDTAGLLGLPLGVSGLVVAVVALRKPIEGNDAELARSWAATLARQVEDGESGVWRQLLGDDTRRINLAYNLHPAAVRPAVAPGAGRLVTDGSGPVTLPDIVTYYRATQPLRLVVTGAPGAGKTVLALELMLALLDGRAEDDPVPVRIPLSRWDTERQSLPELLQQRLLEAYDWPVNLAAGLVRHGMVLPVLDGLDEMDPPAPDGSPDPAAPRATTVIRALNTYQQGRDAGPLILTCRTHHYDALTAHIEVLDAARIAIAPVDTTDARTYLADRALNPARWQPLTDHLAAHPGGLLATVLSTPWRLCLTATVYHHDGDPGELRALPNADALDQHLLTRYIPAATRTTPNPRGYTPQDVHRWLHHLTTHLDPTGALPVTTAAGAEATDLVLHELWPLAVRARVRTTDAILATLTVLTTLPLAWTAPQQLTGQLAAMISVFAVIAGVLATTTGRPKSPTNPFRTPQGRRQLAEGLTTGVVFGVVLGSVLGIAVGLTAGLAVGLTMGLGFGIAVGLALGLALGLTREPGANLGARAVISSDALVGLALGLGSWLAAGFIFGLGVGLKSGLTFGLVAGLVGGLAAGLGAGLTAGAQASRRYAVFLLCSRRRLPFRLGLFLDWAVTAGLMRYSGPAYQYRHRELQHWLRQHPQPPAQP
ncbi:NACHT domain-containing protein [Streptomyces sp. NBC_00124]|uniref:NACHT domain-containing protein n=1 Tax=Streptomyces sp. NBC_00124 TaxID=2975662 RepID=UPI00225A8391|nr:NACHT domain-containing protein [Streptomyces sp. NBC_00124]MCX5357178.1 NACHT domain-containing protein [Streptomyces sp. NBC_00124]